MLDRQVGDLAVACQVVPFEAPQIFVRLGIGVFVEQLNRETNLAVDDCLVGLLHIGRVDDFPRELLRIFGPHASFVREYFVAHRAWASLS